MAATSGVEAASSQKPQSAKKNNGEAATEGEFAKAVSENASGQKAADKKAQESQSKTENQGGEEGGDAAGKSAPEGTKSGDAGKGGQGGEETETPAKAQGDGASQSKAAKILQASRSAPSGSAAESSGDNKSAQDSDLPTSPRESQGKKGQPTGRNGKAQPEGQGVKAEESAKGTDPRTLAKNASDPRERASDTREAVAKDTTRAAEAKTDTAKEKIAARLGGQPTANSARDFGGLAQAQTAGRQSWTADPGGDRPQTTGSQAPTSGSGAEARAAVGTDKASGQARTAPAQQVAVRVAKAASAGQNKLQIDIKPPELGRVEVRIDFQGNSLRVSVGAERQEALDMLQRDARVLTKALNDAGFDTKGGLEFNLRSGGGSRHGKGAPAKFMEFYDETDSGRENASGAAAQAAAPPGARLAITV